MNIDDYLPRLESNQLTIASLVEPVPIKHARWKPHPGSWSILEIINHLHDEEREDFRQRIDYTLNRPGENWPPIDPEGWVTERKYNEQDLEKSLENFLNQRAESLSWLRSLKEVDWDRGYEHPTAGTLRAGDLMASWLAHDYLHIRQLVQRHFLYAQDFSAPYSTAYSGGW